MSLEVSEGILRKIFNLKLELNAKIIVFTKTLSSITSAFFIFEAISVLSVWKRQIGSVVLSQEHDQKVRVVVVNKIVHCRLFFFFLPQCETECAAMPRHLSRQGGWPTMAAKTGLQHEKARRFNGMGFARRFERLHNGIQMRAMIISAAS